jgi:hypothetical protein
MGFGEDGDGRFGADRSKQGFELADEGGGCGVVVGVDDDTHTVPLKCVTPRTLCLGAQHG